MNERVCVSSGKISLPTVLAGVRSGGAARHSAQDQTSSAPGRTGLEYTAGSNQQAGRPASQPFAQTLTPFGRVRPPPVRGQPLASLCNSKSRLFIRMPNSLSSPAGQRRRAAAAMTVQTAKRIVFSVARSQLQCLNVPFFLTPLSLCLARPSSPTRAFGGREWTIGQRAWPAKHIENNERLAKCVWHATRRDLSLVVYGRRAPLSLP